MTSIPLEYVGMKDEESDHLYGTGIIWVGKGDIKDVPADKAPLLLAHPDVWRDARPAATRKKSPITPEMPTSKLHEEPTDLPVAAKIHLMESKDLAIYAQTQFNEFLDPAKPEPELRQEIVRLMNTRG